MTDYDVTVSIEETESKTPSYESLSDHMKNHVDKARRELLNEERSIEEQRSMIMHVATHSAIWHKKRAKWFHEKVANTDTAIDGLEFSLAAAPAKPIMRPIIEYIARSAL